MRQRTVAILAALAVALTLVMTGPAFTPRLSAQDSAATPTPPFRGVFSEIFAAASPAPIADPELALSRVVLAPGATIPPHEHPGTQVATINAGALTYTVLTGSVEVTGADGVQLTLDAGETVTLRPGDAVVEQPGTIHTARARGGEPVEILIATLFPAGAPRTLYQADATPEIGA